MPEARSFPPTSRRKAHFAYLFPTKTLLHALFSHLWHTIRLLWYGSIGAIDREPQHLSIVIGALYLPRKSKRKVHAGKVLPPRTPILI